MRWREASVTALAVCLALAACTRPVSAEIAQRVNCLAPDLPYFASGIVDDRLATGDDAPAWGAFPSDFVPVRAVLCEPAEGGSLRVRLYGGDVSELVAALQRADFPPQERFLCPPWLATPVELWIAASDGSAIRARWPLDGCRQPQGGVRTALGSMSLLDEGTRALPRTGE